MEIVAGVDPTITLSNGMSAMRAARQAGDDAIMKRLAAAGVKE